MERTVRVVFEKDKYGQYWKIQKCPFCDAKHTHGAGPLGDDPKIHLGWRVPHCTKSSIDEQYELVAD